MNEMPTDKLTDSAQVLRGMVYFLAREICLENTHTSIDAQIEVARLCYQDGLDLVEKKPEVIAWRPVEGFPIYEINQYGKVRERISEQEAELLNHGVPFYVLYTFGGLGPASGRYFRTVGELLEKAFPGEEIDHHLGVVKKTEWRRIPGFPFYEMNRSGVVRVFETKVLADREGDAYVLYLEAETLFHNEVRFRSGRMRKIDSLLAQTFPTEEKIEEPLVEIKLEGEVSKKDVEKVKALVDALTEEIDTKVRLRHTSAQIAGIVINRIIQEGWSPK